MNDLKIFKNKNFGKLRTVTINNSPYIVAIDVAKALGYKNPHDAIKRHCKGVVKHAVLTKGGKQKTNCIKEGDIYRLITHSELPRAEQFESWVFDEVLPTIRKTGGYVVEGREEEFIDIYFPTLSEETKVAMVKDLQRSVKVMKPKADYFDNLVERNLLTNFRDTAKELKVKQNFFMEWLEDNNFIYRDSKDKPKPCADYTPELFEMKDFVAPNGFTGVQTFITPRGKETFRLLLQEKGVLGNE
jgi:prophage antirepressor-like protein|nr:MAG TPA: repressor domain protein [Caudoviricetes sp.]